MRKVQTFVWVALAVFIGTCHAGTLPATFMADFRMEKQDVFPNGYVTGKVYYHYDYDTPLNSRIRFETNYNGDSVHVELYHYQNSSLFSICDTCSSTLIGQPEQWEKTDLDEQCSDEGGGYFRCRRSSASVYDIAEFVSRGTASSDNYDIQYIKFNDGREYYFSSVVKISFESYKHKFEVSESDNCPKPVCHSHVDVVFVLDASGSVNDEEWAAQKNFLSRAVDKFNLGPNDAKIGIVEFNGPYKCLFCKEKRNGYCKKYAYTDDHVTNDWNPYWPDYHPGWRDIICNNASLHIRTTTVPENIKDKTRYIDDCAFDVSCINTTDYTGKIFLELSHIGVQDTISDLPRLYGNTCQRYGLQKAYEMLFERNPRCPVGANKSTCPTPVVIVVTDGADFCHESTQVWADKIKNADNRTILLEVGVGLESNYDKQFLRNLSTNLAGFDTAPNVDDYASIDSVLNKIMEPACTLAQSSGGSCGSTCHGYCACTECVCPQCNEEIVGCDKFSCSDVAAENGCKAEEITCNSGTVVDFDCFSEFCDANSQSEDKCVIEARNCAAEYTARPLKPCEYVPCKNGCQAPVQNHTYCSDVLNLLDSKCTIARCDPLNNTADEYGCIHYERTCNKEDFPGCDDAFCEESLGGCVGDTCETDCYYSDGRPKCPNEECIDVHCDKTASEENRCVKEPHVCPESNNKCQKYICVFEDGVNSCELVDDDSELDCAGKNKKDGCRLWKCDPTADNGQGACVVAKEYTHAVDNCVDYTCEEDDMWHATPKCTTERKCKISRCNGDDGSCIEVDVDCRGKVKLPNKCFEAACKEPDGCYKKQYRGAYFDVCGRCISSIGDDSAISYSENEETEDCVVTSDEDLPTEGLAAAAIALIVIGAIIIGAAIALSSVVGTKALIDRARGASDQAVVSNPLFEDSQTEMTNPAFMGDA